MSLKDLNTNIIAMEVHVEDDVDTEGNNAFKYGFASDMELREAPPHENSTLFEILPQSIAKLTLLCFATCVVVYCLCRLFGKLKCKDNNGIVSFWYIMVYGEISASCAAFWTILYLFLREDKTSLDIICTDIDYNTNLLSAYVFLLLWIVFVVAILRAVGSITWLHQISNVERLKDMGRGVGILSLSLLFLVPMAVLGTHNDAAAHHQAPVKTTICFPVWSNPISTDIAKLIITIGYIIGGIMANFMVLKNYNVKHKSMLACPMVVYTHFAPTFFFCSWLSNHLYKLGVPEMFPVIFCLATTINSLCNLCCYKLFELSNPDEPEQESTGKDEKDCELLGSEDPEFDLKLHAVIVPPPVYKEKIELE